MGLEWDIIKGFSEAGSPCFSYDEVRNAFGERHPTYLSQVLSKMVRNGKLLKLQHGLYYIVPLEQSGEKFIPNWHLVAQYLMRDKKHYTGYYSAMQVHKLITQPSLSEIVVTNTQIKPGTIEIRGVKFQFVYHNPQRFFGYERVWIDDYNKINCSNLEKTIVDSFIHPHYSGGIVEIARAVYDTRNRIDKDELFKYFTMAGSKVAAKRYVFICDFLDISDSHHQGLLRNSLNGSILNLDTSLPSVGKISTQYELRINADPQTIKDSIFT